MEQKVMGIKEYKEWLRNKLIQHGIDDSKLIAIVIVAERALFDELSRKGLLSGRPYYKLYGEDRKPTRAWLYAAELALWLKYNNFKVDSYIRASIKNPELRRKIYLRKNKQPSLGTLFPSTRTNLDRLRHVSKEYRSWLIKHG